MISLIWLVTLTPSLHSAAFRGAALRMAGRPTPRALRPRPQLRTRRRRKEARP